MRAYAVLFGTLLTVGSVYVAEIAVKSASPYRAARPAHRTPDAAALDPTWYGGTLQPITVDAGDATTAAVRIMGANRRGQSRSARGPVQQAVPLHPGRVGPTVD